MIKKCIFSDEQNKIIRAPMDKPLIVKGVPGSGKTTLAFERISYLVENEKLNYNNFAFLTSNDFFLNYISKNFSNATKINKYTFESFVFKILGKELRMIDEKERVISLYDRKITCSNTKDLNLRIQESNYKSSLEYKKNIDMYLEYYANKLIPKKDFILSNVRIIKSATVREMFFQQYKDLPFEERFNRIKQDIFLKIQKNSYDIIKQIIEKRSVDIQYLMKKDLTAKQVRTQKCKIFGKTEKLLQMLYKSDESIVDLYFGELKLKNARTRYKDFITNFATKNIEDKQLGIFLVENTRPYVEKSAYKFEDLPAILYIHNKVFGTIFSDEIKHIVIDNIQDYGEFQFFVIQDFLKSNSFTLFGDIAQAIYFHRSVNNWKNFTNKYFPKKEINFIELNKTYTTSPEITGLANRVLTKLPKENRKMTIYGNSQNNIDDTLRVMSLSNFDAIGREIARKIRAIDKNDEYKSVAIIARDIKECRSIRKAIGNYIMQPILIENTTLEYKDKVCVIPSYLAKGMKFDYVFVINASKNNFIKDDILDIKLFYIAITKAQKKLDIYFIKNISDLMIE